MQACLHESCSVITGQCSRDHHVLHEEYRRQGGSTVAVPDHQGASPAKEQDCQEDGGGGHAALPDVHDQSAA